jgi:hypothetical protein
MSTGRILFGVAIILGIGMAFVVIGTQRLARWEVVDVRDPAHIEMACGRTSMNGPASGDTVEPGLIITGLDSTLTLGLDGFLVLHMTPNSVVNLPPAPARWLGRHRVLRVDDGEIALTSGERELGRTLVVDTLAGRIILHGASLVVRYRESSIDILQSRGVVEVRTPDGGVRRLAGEVGIRLREGIAAEMIPVDETAHALIRALSQNE